MQTWPLGWKSALLRAQLRVVGLSVRENTLLILDVAGKGLRALSRSGFTEGKPATERCGHCPGCL